MSKPVTGKSSFATPRPDLDPKRKSKRRHPSAKPLVEIPAWAHSEDCGVPGCMRCDVRDDYRGDD